ncbi:MAG: hypothetical protein U0271_41590 [Polyangiaceae bacterium]
MSALLFVAAAGCGDEKPYVPFSMSSGAGSTSASASAVGPVGSAPLFTPVEATPATGERTSFPVGDATIQAPKGKVFVSGIVADADADGTDDLVIWMQSKNGAKGQLLFFKLGAGEPTPVELVALPKDLDVDVCAHDTKLTRIGAGVVRVRITAQCGSPVHRESWVGVVRFGSQAGEAPSLGLDARASAPLDVDGRTLDKDADGREDLVLTVSLEGADAPSADLVLLNRPAGFSADPSEPAASLGKLGQGLLNKGVAKKADTAERARAVQRFVAAFCSDLGKPRFSTGALAVRCKDSRVVPDTIHAMFLAAMNQNDLPRAAAAIEALAALKTQDGRMPQLENPFYKKVKKVEITSVRKATPTPLRRAAARPALEFDEAGALHVTTDSGVTKINVADLTETASDRTAPRPSIGWGTGDSYAEIASGSMDCGESATTLSAAARGSRVNVELPIIALGLPPQARKEKCAGIPLSWAPITMDERGPIVAVGGESFQVVFGTDGFRASAVAPSAAKPPTDSAGFARTGDATVYVLRRGFLITTPSKTELWKGAPIENMGRCVVDAAGQNVACEAPDGTVVVSHP